jgi:hypothetical protein
LILGQLTTVEEKDALMDELFAAASSLLEEDDLELVRSATTLTLQVVWGAWWG